LRCTIAQGLATHLDLVVLAFPAQILARPRTPLRQSRRGSGFVKPRRTA